MKTGGWLIVQKHLETFNGEVGPHPVFADVDRVAFSKVTRESRCKGVVGCEWRSGSSDVFRFSAWFRVVSSDRSGEPRGEWWALKVTILSPLCSLAPQVNRFLRYSPAGRPHSERKKSIEG